MAEKIQLTISGLLQDLKDGLTRDNIAEKYNLNKTQVKNVFQHPKLKNRKTIKPKDAAFMLIDDTEAPEVADPAQLELDLDLPTAPPEEVEVENVPEVPVDAYTQVGVELTDDTVTTTITDSNATTTTTAVPEVTTTEGVW